MEADETVWFLMRLLSVDWLTTFMVWYIGKLRIEGFEFLKEEA